MLRDHLYFVMMGACLLLFIAAWSFVRLYSLTAAIVMSCVALVIPRWPPQWLTLNPPHQVMSAHGAPT
jgi:hypothetical protein